MKEDTTQFLEKASEIWGAVIIILSFAGVATIVGLTTNFLIKGVLGMIVGILSGICVLIFGIRIAIKYYRGKGTFYLISRTSATPELDNKDED